MNVTRQGFFDIWKEILAAPPPLLSESETLEMIHLEMVKDDPTMIQHISDPTHEMCWIAYEADPVNLQWLKRVPDDICEDACKKDLSLLRFMKQTVRLCKTAVSVNVEALEHMYDHHPDVCSLAIQLDPFALRYIRSPSLAMCMQAVSSNGLALAYVPEQLQCTELIETAVHNDYRSFQYVIHKTRDLCLRILAEYPDTLQYVDQTLEYCLTAIQSDYAALRHVKRQTKDLCWKAIDIDWRSLEYVRDQSIDLCIHAVDIDKRATKLIRKK